MTPAATSLPAPGQLTDGVIELRLLRVLGPRDAAHRSATAQFIAVAPEYRFAIHRVADGVRVGRIHFRVTNDSRVLSAIGHAGYAVDEQFQRQGYATRAVMLVRQLARQHSISPIWILIAPENVASRRTVEKAGFRFMDIVEASPDAIALGLEPQLCRYAAD